MKPLLLSPSPMHSLPKIPKMKPLLSSHLPSPPHSLPISPSPSRTHFLALPRISGWKPPNPISFLPKPATSARRACSSAQIDGGKKLPPFGEIHVIVGPMFAGKTTALLRRIQSESSIGRKYALIKSNKDDRYGLDSVVTHDGVKMPCWALSKLSIFRATIGDKAYEELDVIGIDEAQFFEDLYDFCRHAADYDGKTVFVAGLDGDYLRRRFGSVMDIIPLADSVTKLTARCEMCGSRAFFTLRKTTDTQTEVIGGADVYMPVCRQHYVDGQVAVETARLVLESHKAQHHEAASSSTS